MGEYVSPPLDLPASVLEEISKVGPVLDVGAKTIALGQVIISNFSAQRHKNATYATVSYLIFTQGFRTFNTIQVLCRVGCGSDALALCGSLFENYVDLCYIGKAPYRRAKRYSDFEQVEKYFQARRILKRRRLPRGWRKMYREYEAALEPQVKQLLKYFPEKKHKAGWSGKSIAERAKEVKQGLHYENLYWIFCAHKHTQPMIAASLVLEDGGDIDLVYSPSPKGVLEAAEYSTAYFLDLSREFQLKHGLGKDSEIRTLSDELEKTVEKVRNVHPDLCRPWTPRGAGKVNTPGR
jgi:hypothetical protein